MQRSQLEDAPDTTLADRAGDGDVRAIGVLMRRHSPTIRVYAGRILGSTTDVDDVVQDTFVTAWQQLPGLADTSHVRGWLMTIASRKAIDRVRARKTHDDIADHDLPALSADGPEERSERSGRHHAIRAVLAALPEAQRQCWVLKELGDYSYDDIALELQLPVSTVRGLLSRARKSMIRELEVWR